MNVRNTPSERVEVVVIQCQLPWRNRAMTTGTKLEHAEYPSLTLTCPVATSRRRVRESEIERRCGLSTVKFPLLVAVPDGVESLILPVVAPLGTTAVTVPSFTNEKLAADFPLNFTPFTPVKLDPKIVTTVPAVPVVGEKLVIFGPLTWNEVPLVSVP